MVYAYQPAGFDPVLVDIVRPDRVLLQITQRFLHGSPATGKRVFDSTRRKFDAMPTESRAALRERLAALPERFHPLAGPLLDD